LATEYQMANKGTRVHFEDHGRNQNYLGLDVFRKVSRSPAECLSGCKKSEIGIVHLNCNGLVSAKCKQIRIDYGWPSASYRSFEYSSWASGTGPRSFALSSLGFCNVFTLAGNSVFSWWPPNGSSASFGCGGSTGWAEGLAGP
jgi:hypothetical protein